MQRKLKKVGIGVGFLLLLLVGLKMYAISQWPSLSDVPAIELPNPIAKGEPEAWKTLENIFATSSSDYRPKDLKDIFRYNYKEQNTKIWRNSSEHLHRFTEMRAFSHMELPTPPLDYHIEGLNLLPLMYLLKLNSFRSWEALKEEKVTEAIDFVSDFSLNFSNMFLFILFFFCHHCKSLLTAHRIISD